MSEDDKQSASPEQSEPVRGVVLTPAQIAARGKRNIAIAFSLLAFVVLVFFATYIRLTGNIETRIQDGTAPPDVVKESLAN